MKLDEKMERFGGKNIGGWQRRQSPVDSKVLTSSIAPLLSKKMDSSMIKWAFVNYPVLYRLFKNDNKIFCSEGMCETLKEIGDIDKDVVCGGMSPKDFVGIDGYEKMEYFSLE